MRTLLLALTVSCLSPSVGLAVVVSDVMGSHATTPGVPAFGVNVDGVVAIGWEDVTFGSGALVTDRHILTAAHLVDIDEDGVVDDFLFADLLVFFDLPGGRVAVPVQSAVVPDAWTGATMEGSTHDIAVIELAEDAPAAAPRYALYAGGDEIGQPIVIVGYGMTGTGDVGMVDTGFDLPKRAGLNRYEVDMHAFSDGELPPNGLIYDFDSGLEANNVLAAWGFPSDLGFGDDEVNAAEGDSGGPVFLRGAIAGVSSSGMYLDDDPADFTPWPDASWGELALDTRVSSYRDFLTSATGGQAVFVVPEPTTLIMLLTGGLCLSLCLRRRRPALRCRRAEGPRGTRLEPDAL